MFNKYPYTDFHELNLDWFLSQFKELVADWEDFHTTISAEWAAVQQEWTDTKEAWQTLYNYVHDYFDNLDVQEEIDNKLDQMVEDGTLITVIAPYLPFVTPEMFGAKGDGITDDTAAWQAAVNSGRNVKAPKGMIYKIGKVTITTNIDIDCGMSKFIQTASEMFYAEGTVETTPGTTGDYTHYDSGYVLNDPNKPDYTGYAFLQGTNSLDLSRVYYKSGFPASFINGYMVEAYPVDVTNITVTYYSPITVNISNILDIVADDAVKDLANCYSIHIKYGINCCVRNVIASNVHIYMLINIDRCLNTVVDQIFTHSNAINATGNSYHIALMDSCFSNVTNCKLNNDNWHCITTGGSALVYKTIIRDCVLNSNLIYAYCDHPNAIDTVIDNVTATFGLSISQNGEIRNCSIYAHDDSSNYGVTKIALYPSNFDHLGRFTIENVTMIGNANTLDGSSGVDVVNSLGLDGVDSERYVNEIRLNNVFVLDPTGTKTFGSYIKIKSISLDYPVHVYKIHLNNTNVPYQGNNDTVNNIDLTNCKYEVYGLICKTLNGSSLMPFGTTNLTMPADTFIDDSEFSYPRGNYTNFRFGIIRFTTIEPNNISITGAILGDIMDNSATLNNFAVFQNTTEVSVNRFKYTSAQIGMMLRKQNNNIGFTSQIGTALQWFYANASTSWAPTAGGSLQ